MCPKILCELLAVVSGYAVMNMMKMVMRNLAYVFCAVLI
jgi:hypothetical protein